MKTFADLFSIYKNTSYKDDFEKLCANAKPSDFYFAIKILLEHGFIENNNILKCL